MASGRDSQGKTAQYCARRYLWYSNYLNAAPAASTSRVFLPYVSFPRANFYLINYNAFALSFLVLKTTVSLL